MSDPLPETIADESPSVKLVYHALDDADTPATQRELKRRTRSSTRTVRRALNRLQDHDLIRRTPADPPAHFAYTLRSD